MTKEQFLENYNNPFTGKIETNYKKMSYISWASMYAEVMQSDPEFTFETIEAPDGLPYFSRNDVNIVKTKCTFKGVTKGMFLPVMDSAHNAVKNPDSRDVGDSLMRCFVKNMALFGFGLKLYSKEDISKYMDEPGITKTIKTDVASVKQPTTKSDTFKTVSFSRENAILAITELPNYQDVVVRYKEMTGKDIGNIQFVTTVLLKQLYQEFIIDKK